MGFTYLVHINSPSTSIPCLLKTCDESLLTFPLSIGADCCLWHAEGVFCPPVPPPPTVDGPGAACDIPTGPLVVLICSDSVPLGCPRAPFWLKPIPAGADIVRLYGYFKLAERERTPDRETPSALTPDRTRPIFPCCPGPDANDEPCEWQGGCNEIVYISSYNY